MMKIKIREKHIENYCIHNHSNKKTMKKTDNLIFNNSFFIYMIELIIYLFYFDNSFLLNQILNL